MVALPLALIAAAQITPVPVPPAPPAIRSGTIRCNVFDRSGARAELTGELGNWRRLPNGTPVADMDLHLAGENERLARVFVTMAPLKAEFVDVNSPARMVTEGSFGVGYGADGWIMLERGELGSTTLRMGFCETHFSTAARNLPQ
jgi:hypothetical protein